MLFAASSASTHSAPADIKPSFVFLPPSSLSLSLSLARSLSTLLFSRSSRSNDADVDRTIVLYVHYVLIPRGPGYIISMLYFHPLSRCNQIFFSWRKDKLPNLPDLDSRSYLENESVGFSRGQAKYRRLNHYGALLYTQNITDRRDYQAKRPKYASTHPPTHLPSLPPNVDRGRSSMARVARGRNDTRWPLRFKAPDICGIKKLFPMNGRRSVVSARMLG